MACAEAACAADTQDMPGDSSANAAFTPQAPERLTGRLDWGSGACVSGIIHLAHGAPAVHRSGEITEQIKSTLSAMPPHARDLKFQAALPGQHYSEFIPAPRHRWETPACPQRPLLRELPSADRYRQPSEQQWGPHLGPQGSLALGAPPRMRGPLACRGRRTLWLPGKGSQTDCGVLSENSHTI